MAGELPLLVTPEQLQDIRRLLSIIGNDSLSDLRPSTPGDFNQSPNSHLAYVGSTAITARSGTTPGSGTVIVKRLNRSSGAIESVTNPDASDYEITVYSAYASASGVNTYVHVARDKFGTWWFRNEDCQ